MITYLVPDFPNFGDYTLGSTNPEIDGLRQLSLTEKKNTKEDIEKFKTFFPVLPNNIRQPNFFISRCSWELLANGIARDGSGNLVKWLPSTYEVIGFVFCLAIESQKFAYFRIRSIIRRKPTKIPSLIVPRVVTDNIAYVSLQVAFENERTGSKNDCIVFVPPSAKSLRDKINKDIILKNSGSQSKLPGTFSEGIPKNHHELVLLNEGHIFGKFRIWNDILFNKYPDKAGTLISLAIKKAKEKIDGENIDARKVYFNFKINDEYNTSIDCPKPPVCN